MKEILFALFQDGIGQTTKYMSMSDALSFETKTTRHTWFQDTNGNTYSLFELYSLYAN